MKVVSVFGARPQFIKVAAISYQINKTAGLSHVIVDTGQHFHKNMSDIFIKELNIPRPNYSLTINSLSHSEMTGQMLCAIEDVLMKEKPDIVLVYGDTNSTLAGALAAKKLKMRVGHVEAGLRSFNMKMPEEVNRVVADRVSDILFCPTNAAVRNLKNEGFDSFKCRIIKSGDVMADSAYFSGDLAKKPDFRVPDKFILATVHRAENTDDIQKLRSIFNALNKISEEIDIIFPIHPRTKKIVEANNIKVRFKLVDAVGYLAMIYLIKNCSLVMTDSGGLQKEAFLFHKPSVILRNETEWVELLENDFSVLGGSETNKIYQSYKEMINKSLDFNIDLYGDGNASEIIVKELLK